MKLSNYINIAELNKAIGNGYVERKDSPCGNFALFDYTRSAQFEGMWSDPVVKCRGLVVDINDDTIVGMCIPKFHNLTEGAPHHLKMYRDCVYHNLRFDATEKMDGSFGNMWWDKYKNMWRVSTRGSFNSDQANWANEWIKNIDFDGVFTDTNYIVEIIYPENRVVVDYGDRKELVLLTGYVHTQEGSNIIEMTSAQINNMAKCLGLSRPEFEYFESIDDIVKKCESLGGNHEGYVLRFENDFRVKVKGKEYCRLHKILSGLSTKAVWENIIPETLVLNQDWLAAVPEEFRDEIVEYADGLIDRIANEYMRIDGQYMLSQQAVIDVYGGSYSKKEYIEILRHKQFSNDFHDILLAYGGKCEELKEKIWKSVQPDFRKMTIVGEDE
jgi:RNA ligase